MLLKNIIKVVAAASLLAPLIIGAWGCYEKVPEIEMVLVEGGTFTMGCTPEQESDCEERGVIYKGGTFIVDEERIFNSEIPTHSVTVGSFYIGKYEVTQRQWKQVMKPDFVWGKIDERDFQTGTQRQWKRVMRRTPSSFKGDDLPVEMVSWNDAQRFIKRLNEISGKKYRLPTEAEWEYAARGGANSRGYKYSGSNNIDVVAWFGAGTKGRTHPVGSKQPNELGIYDMSGNVREWVNDWYEYYTPEAKVNPVGPSSGVYNSRVIRGGDWFIYQEDCRVSARWSDGENIFVSDFGNGVGYGFRLALSHP